MSVQQSLLPRTISGLLVCASLLTTGCYSISKEFTISQGKVSQYLDCLTSPGGRCDGKTSTKTFLSEHTESAKMIGTLRDNLPAGVENELKQQNNSSALKVWNDPIQKKIIAFYEYLNTRDPPKNDFLKGSPLVKTVDEVGTNVETYSLKFDTEELRDYQEHILESVQSQGWDALESAATIVVGSLKKDRVDILGSKEIRAEAKNDQIKKLEIEIQRAETMKRVASYVRAYLGAYFRNGEFLKINFDLGTLEAKLTAEMNDRFPLLDAKTREGLVKNLLAKLKSDKFYFGGIGATGFVTRSGDIYQFPPLEARLDPLAKRSVTLSKIDFAVVGADLARVVLEATFDAISQLPAVSNATGAVSEDIPDGNRLSVHDPTITPSNMVNEKEFGEVNSFAGQTEAVTSTAFGQLIRGAGWVSLNNEYLGKFLETLMGVTVRKIMEQCAWCYYACGLNDPQINPSEGKTTNGNKTIVKVTVTGSRGLF